jgi:hypothetical protein
VTAARSQQHKAAAVQKAVAARKQRYLACAFTKLHAAAVHGLGERLDVVGLAGFDQRSDDCVVLSSAVVSPVHRAAGSVGETNFGTTSLAAPRDGMKKSGS